MTELAHRIEVHLLTHQGWVSAEELCQHFDIDERDLRAVGNRPGLCTEFAISGNKGFRHVRCASAEEFEHCISRLHSHGISELKRVKILREARTKAPTGRPAYEKFTGQGLLI